MLFLQMIYQTLEQNLHTQPQAELTFWHRGRKFVTEMLLVQSLPCRINIVLILKFIQIWLLFIFIHGQRSERVVLVLPSWPPLRCPWARHRTPAAELLSCVYLLSFFLSCLSFLITYLLSFRSSTNVKAHKWWMFTLDAWVLLILKDFLLFK